LLLLLTSTFLVQAQAIDLDAHIEVQFRNISLKETLDIISQKYDIRFSYSDSRLNSSQLVSGNYVDISLDQFLSEFLSELQINYAVIDQQIVLFPFNKNQTIKITGKVVDEMDGSPIPYANISLPETGKGTSTNEDGEFEIALTKLPSELMVSHLSHEKKLVDVYNDQSELIIELFPAQKELNEITVVGKGNRNAYYHLVKKACEKLNEGTLNDQNGKAFYRQKSRREGSYTEIFEMFYDIRYSSIGIRDWAVQEGRYAFQQNEEYDIFLYNKNFTLLSRMFPVRQPATESFLLPVNPEVKKFFDLKLREIIKYENRYIAILDYAPKPTAHVPAPSGQLYIDFEDYSILKCKGHFQDAELQIIGFSDAKSAWENYRLDFEVSFIDDPSDNLQLDYIKIDHHFDYFYNNDFIGKINTSSLLTFYEHYTPAKNKKLGGPIDFKMSDMELVDRLGYNPVFWKQNPIVRRTPIEEKLIGDFEQNEACGPVFINNDEEVVLLPDDSRTERAKQIVAQFEGSHQQKSAQEIFVRLDKPAYQPDDKIRFAAYIFDRWTFRPPVMGSVLTINLKNRNGELKLSDNFDITEGAAYGEIPLNEFLPSGAYTLEAHTNVDTVTIFKTNTTISPFSASICQISSSSDQEARAPALVAEGGTLLDGVATRLAYSLAPGALADPIQPRKIVDQHGQLIQTIYPNKSGIGSFMLTPSFGDRYYLLDLEAQEERLPLPEVASTGISIKVASERERSLQINMIQKPALPREIYVLSAHRGKVSSIFKTKLIGQNNTFELPMQCLLPGINDLVITDKQGNMLVERQVYHAHEKIDIEIVSAGWKSKRSKRLELLLNISDNNGAPKQAMLSAISFQQQGHPGDKCDIRNELLLSEVSWRKQINFDTAGDSLYQALDNLLLLEQAKVGASHYTSKTQGLYQTDDSTLELSDDAIFAEVNVSSSFYSQNLQRRKMKKRIPDTSSHEIFWIPKLSVDENGMTKIELKVPNKNQSFRLNIQGLSDDGALGTRTLTVNPSEIKADRKSGKK
jgi:hypothetical protein